MESVGGARIGWCNASWALAKFKASADELNLRVLMLGTYRFRPDQVVGISLQKVIPLLGTGIQIEHNVAKYPAEVIFGCKCHPDRLLADLGHSGFTRQAAPETLRKDPDFPWLQVAAIVLISVAMFWLP